MSKRNYYDAGNGKYSRRSGKMKEIPATEQMLKLIRTSKIFLDYDHDTISIHNGKASGTITFDYTGDPSAVVTAYGLDQGLVKSFGCTKEIALEWIGLFGDELQRLFESGDLEDEDEQEKKTYYIHKYTPPDGRLIEAVVVGGKPYFIQMKEGSELDFSLMSEYSTDSRILKPRGVDNYQCDPILFESKDQIKHYLMMASKLSTNLNFDRIFKLVKRIFNQYVVIDDHYITLLVADTIYSYFQDRFATTHYIMCVGDNSSGKNSILLTFASLGYHVFIGTSSSAANDFTALGSLEHGQVTIVQDELDNIDDQHDKMNIWKSGYSIVGSRIPKTDLNGGRTQELFHSFCFKMCASEREWDSLKAKGLLDRCFIIRCLVGKPKYNIKKVREKTKTSEYLSNEIERTRKLLFACRMIHHGNSIENVGLNLINREAELVEPVIRVFQNSPETKKELLPALLKCLNAKRKVKSTSLEAVLYRVIKNLCPKEESISTSVVISNESIQQELIRITDGVDIPEKRKIYCRELGIEVDYGNITKILSAKFRAEPDHIGRGDQKRRALRFTKEDLDRKSIDYDVPDEIKILPYDKDISLGPDSFDLMLREDEVGTPGTPGTPLGDKEDNVKSGTDGGIASDIDCENEVTSTEKSADIFPGGVPTVPTVPKNQAAKVDDPEGVQNTNQESQPLTQDTIDEERARRSHDLPMPEQIEDGLPIISEKDLEPFQKPPPESWNPIISIEEFFTDDLPLSSHGFVESPCFPIINVRYGETKTEFKYYCELHPDFENNFIETIERHCRETEPNIHRDVILSERNREKNKEAISKGEST